MQAAAMEGVSNIDPISEPIGDGGQTTSDQRVLAALRRLIMDGSIPAGEKISEVELSNLLKVSRTPIRLALKTLEFEGLIRKRDGRGYRVCNLDFDDVSKACEVRSALEGLAARRLAITGPSPEADAALDRSLDMTAEGVRLFGARDRKGMALYQAGDALFHDTVLEACDNAFVRFTLARFEHLPMTKPGTLTLAQGDHDRVFLRLSIDHGQHVIIADAIRKRDPARAEAMMREHSLTAGGH
jgi:GntR family transcriptional regulator of vanillate catabolism